jgi:hypothetical protein
VIRPRNVSFAGATDKKRTEINRVEAAKEGVVPRAGVLGALLVEVVAALGDGAVEALHPVLHVGVVDGARVVGGRSLLGLRWSRHCDGFNEESKKLR